MSPKKKIKAYNDPEYVAKRKKHAESEKKHKKTLAAINRLKEARSRKKVVKRKLDRLKAAKADREWVKAEKKYFDSIGDTTRTISPAKTKKKKKK